MTLKSVTLSLISLSTLVLSSVVNAATLVEDFNDLFPQWESGWLGLNSSIENYYGAGSALEGYNNTEDFFLWIADGDAESKVGENVDITFDTAFGLSLTSLAIDINTYVDTSIQVFDGSGSVILSTALGTGDGYDNLFVSSLSGISGFSLISDYQIEGNTGIDNVVVTTVVPVPAAAWLFGSGLIGLAGFTRRKKIYA